jgi:CheY-like chemotaxis protein
MSNVPSTSKHVLVVDDEPDFAALLRSMLVKAGYTVVTAYNGEDALAEVRTCRPDIITLDMKMPRQSGVHFYRTLKKNHAFRDVPVVVVSGLTRDDKDMENLIRSLLEPDNVPHPQAYMEKPVDEPQFLKTIQETLSPSASG